ncbi:NAD(P)H-dependent oxidoreductase [Streptomyces sp. MST-110588]|uniref:NADPH-dependent FMN reductase n=1 Tax=Streptomyces sp. MST-110588 TaxID=2833628 RepID=UPI001F5E2B88|nr:NAD(P)H-dependent oxidoreductase [Streptomyces sp. MST-110588]UNO38558.1 NAD(P)H-dependent oxidoreductase [Streptomyces sp. MST-110588]
MRALVITGSPHLKSSTAALAAVAGSALTALGATVRTMELGAPRGTARPADAGGSADVAFPAGHPDGTRDTGALRHTVDGQAAQLRLAVADADAVVLASPVHHAGYSGLLKTALDQLSGDAFEDKAVGLLAHGSGPRTGNVVCEQLRTVAKALGGWVVPTQVAGCPEDFTTGPDAIRTPSPELLLRCRALAGELHRCATMLGTPLKAVRERATA